MQIKVDRKGTALIVQLMGNLSEFGVAGRFYDSVSENISPDIRHLVYNFDQTSLPDSRFIGKMVEIYKNNRDRVKMYALCDQNDDVKELLLICGMTHILTFLSSESQIPS